MLGAAYNWIGIGVGSIAVLLATSATIQDLRDSPRDYGDAAFAIVFGIFWAAVATGSGYGLLHRRRLNVTGGCLTITAVTGGLILLVGGLLAAVSIDSAHPPDRLMVAVLLGIGGLVLLPSALVLRHPRDPRPEAQAVRRWEALVFGVMITFLGAVLYFGTLKEPYEVGMVGHVSIAVLLLVGAVVAAGSSLLLWRAGPSRGRGASEVR